LTAAETSAAPSASRFDPEELREEIRAYQSFVAKFMGDGSLHRGDLRR
jgi:hypothetical protein